MFIPFASGHSAQLQWNCIRKGKAQAALSQDTCLLFDDRYRRVYIMQRGILLAVSTKVESRCEMSQHLQCSFQTFYISISRRQYLRLRPQCLVKTFHVPINRRHLRDHTLFSVYLDDLYEGDLQNLSGPPHCGIQGR